MEVLKKVVSKWGAFGEWFSIVGPIFGLFIYVHHENSHLNDRLDTHMTEINHRLDTHISDINRRADQLNERLDNHLADANRRWDAMHQEFMELLKEQRQSLQKI